MKRLLAFFALLMGFSFAHLVGLPAYAQNGEEWGSPSDIGRDLPLMLDMDPEGLFSILVEARRPESARQVRVEQRIVVRVAPSSEATRSRLMAELPRRPMPTQYQEDRYGNCMTLAGLAGVQPIENRKLLLITKNRRLYTARLDRGCNARAFYLGFYIERHSDGRLCVNRDYLKARTGASCQIMEFRRLVAVRE